MARRNRIGQTDIRSAAEDRLDPDGALRAALGRAPDEQELELWAGMPTDRRLATLARISVLRRWVDEPGELTAAEAAREAKVAVSRFYEIAAAWKASSTLHSLGTFAKRPGRRGSRLDGDVVNTIQSILPGVVASGGREAKVSRLVAQLAADPRLVGADLPHVNTLRTMVERERRRQRAEQLVGLRPGLDASACELLRPDGRHHIMFAVVDRTSRLILGFSVGEVGDSRSAYARASRDALRRISAPEAAAWPWADGTQRIDVVAGADGDALMSLRARYEAGGTGPFFGIVGTGRRFGRYLKIVAGDAVGGLRLFRARTESDAVSDSGLKYNDADATTAIELGVAKHNAAVMAASVAEGSARPAPDTLRILKFLADA
ncbi:hypothetical protein [Sphingomonas sp. HMP6]|uniref:hypothetical protein n=1 Tax=Sphingomonas sp. HMP6 TaxID=1517551 RepID=UPI00159697EA|nr:hypothetical protein [Sphingomonas sp. HMP6]BCA58127.1 hypothetical protein HMP06_0896 [Sphingomonas sp. HMP6]